MTFTSANMPALTPNPFSESLPFQPWAWNNSWLQQAMHCPRHFWYSAIRGLRRQGDGGSVHLSFGSLVHAGAELFSKALGAGVPAEEATELALAHVLAESWPEGELRDVFGGYYGEVIQCRDRTRTNRKKGIKRCAYSYKEHLAEGDGDGCPGCGGPVDRRTAYLCPEKVKNRWTLCRAVVALCDHLAAGNVRPKTLPDGRVGAEVRWVRELDLPSPDPSRPYILTGTFDGVAEAPGTPCLLPEYKSTQREPNAQFFAGYEMSPQVHTYTAAGQAEFGRGTRVHLYAIHVGVGFCEIYQKPVWLSPASLEEWDAEVSQKIREFELRARLAQAEERAGRDPAAAYPRNLAGCNSLPGASTTPCPFRDFCRLPPGDRESFLSSNFEIAPHSPLEVHGVAGEEVQEG